MGTAQKAAKKVGSGPEKNMKKPSAVLKKPAGNGVVMKKPSAALKKPAANANPAFPADSEEGGY